MAVESTLAKSALTLKYKEGVDESGKDIIKNKKYSNVKVMSADQDIFDVSVALATIMKYPILEILRSNDSTLANA